MLCKVETILSASETEKEKCVYIHMELMEFTVLTNCRYTWTSRPPETTHTTFAGALTSAVIVL